LIVILAEKSSWINRIGHRIAAAASLAVARESKEAEVVAIDGAAAQLAAA
jgi:hypothetical protein